MIFTHKIDGILTILNRHVFFFNGLELINWSFFQYHGTYFFENRVGGVRTQDKCDVTFAATVLAQPCVDAILLLAPRVPENNAKLRKRNYISN